MGSIADYAENKLLDKLLNATNFTSPATLYFGLSTTTVTDAGTNITEPVGNNYARVAVTANTTNMPAASGGAIANGTAVTFPTASGSWGTITDVFISDAASGGNILAVSALTASKTVGASDTPSFAVGALTFSLS